MMCPTQSKVQGSSGKKAPHQGEPVRNALLAQVHADILNHQLVNSGDHVFVAVSGGLDSMVLLDCLHRLSSTLGLRLSVVHFNHRLRGRDSGNDVRFVKAVASRYRLPFHCGEADVQRAARLDGESIEMAARKARHRFFVEMAQSQGASIVALAHHADDQVELFFLRLLRGSGLEGLAGMKWSNRSPAAAGVTLIRPLLGVSKRQLSAFAKESRLKFREDATNTTADYLRNRIRNRLLPVLRKEYQPALNSAVLRLMDMLAAEGELCSSLAKSWSAGRELVLPADFGQLPLAVQREVIRARLVELRVPFGFDLIEYLRLNPGSWISAGPLTSLKREASGALKQRRQKTQPPFKPKDQVIEVELGSRVGHADLSGVHLSWDLEPCIENTPLPPRRHGIEYFDAGALGGRISFRHWRAGDRFQPIGMHKSLKVQDFFSNQKVLRERRHELILGCSEAGQLFWIEGLRISERFKVTPQTRLRLRLRWHRALSGALQQ